MTSIPPDTQKILETLKRVAANTLERKRRLGHYAVIWQDGRPMTIGEDAPNDYTQERQNWVAQTSLEDVLAAMKQHQGEETIE